MAYGTMMEFNVDLDTHVKIIDAVGDVPIDGLIVHAAGPSDAGICSIDVWESKDASDRFFAERLMPAMSTLDLPDGAPVSFAEFDLPVLLRG